MTLHDDLIAADLPADVLERATRAVRRRLVAALLAGCDQAGHLDGSLWLSNADTTAEDFARAALAAALEGVGVDAE